MFGLVVLSLTQDVVEAYATADTAEFALLGHDFCLVVRAGFGRMEAIWAVLVKQQQDRVRVNMQMGTFCHGIGIAPNSSGLVDRATLNGEALKGSHDVMQAV